MAKIIKTPTIPPKAPRTAGGKSGGCSSCGR